MLSLVLSKVLLRLSLGEPVNFGAVTGDTNRDLLRKMIDDGVIDYESIGTQRKKLFCRDVKNLQYYVQNQFSIPSLEQYIVFKEQELSERSEAARVAGNSKLDGERIYHGFLINSYGSEEGRIGDSPIQLRPVQGTYQFIHDYKSFTIPTHLTVVVVENYENFKYVDRQRHLFSEIDPLFIWRYQNSNVIAEWLELIPNNYMHFGDFDPKGLQIYISEFKSKTEEKRSMFFVPRDLEQLFKLHGNKARYEDQVNRISSADFKNYPEVDFVWRLITKYKCGVDQEVLIRGS